MGRYIECGNDVVYKYGLDQPSNLYIIHNWLKLGRLKHYTAEESYMNGCDMLYLNKEDIEWLKGYYVKEIERENKKSLREIRIGEDISIDEANFLRMINHLLHYAEQHPEKDVYAFDSEL